MEPRAGGNVRLRIARASDAAAFAAIYAPYVRDTAVSFEESAPSEAEMARRIDATVVAYPWLTAERDGEILGYAYASKHRERAAYRWSVDVSAYVAPNARRAGVGGRLYRALFTLLARQGYVRAYAGIALPNEPSIALHRSQGFVLVGVYEQVGFKLGRWHDVSWWVRPLRDAPVPAEPRRLEELNADDVAAALG